MNDKRKIKEQTIRIDRCHLVFVLKKLKGDFKMNKKDYFAEVSRQLDENVSMTDVLKAKGFKIIGEQRRHAKCLCPFHGDRSYGSFVVSNQKKVYKCFSCGEGGGSVHKLIYQLDQIEQNEKSFTQSIMDAAYQFGIVSPQDYEWFFKRKVSESSLESVKDYYLSRKGEELTHHEMERAPLVVRHQIYTILSEGAKLQNPSKKKVDFSLLPEHYEFLLNEKHLTVQQIKRGDYFSMPNRYSWPWFVRRLLEEGIVPPVENWKDADLSILKGVPGFMQYRDTEKWTCNTVSGIGIALRNAEGYISGVQVRHDKVKTGSNRYRFYSSSFADELDEKYMNGVGAGSPIAVLYPDEIKSKALFITEGHIKANVLSNVFDAISVSVQGVNSWRGLADELTAILKQGYYITHFFIAYDADMAYNIGVFKQAISMTNRLKEAFPTIQIMMVSWDVEYGKGIDDMLIAGHKEKLARLPKTVFDPLFFDYERKLIKDYQIKTPNDWRNVPKEVMQTYFYDLVLSQFPGYEHLKKDTK